SGRSLRHGGSSLARLLRRPGFLELGLECLLISGHKIDDEPRRLVVARLEHKGLVDQEWSAYVDDDARLSWRKQPIAVGRDESPLFFADAVRHLKIDVRGVDDDPVGIAEGKHVDIDLVRKVGNEASAFLVSRNACIVCDGRIRSRVGLQAKACPARDDEGGNNDSSHLSRGWQGALNSHCPPTCLNFKQYLFQPDAKWGRIARPTMPQNGIGTRPNLNHVLVKRPL